MRKAEIQAQKRSEKAAKEAAAKELDMKSYKHVMTVRSYMCASILQSCGKEVATSAC